ncbi:MAG: metallophosphoesterase family protein [Clostridia bacterium]|nr:metallophosphoesterase family protein [Clostridia bacterium]
MRRLRPVHPPHKPWALGAALAKHRLFRHLPPFRAAAELNLKEYTVSSPDLPEAFDGLRIAYASDIHYGALLDEARVRDLAERLNALDADVLLLGGDYGDDTSHALAFWKVVPELRARLAVCAVLGNHDRAEGPAEPFIIAMRERGVTPLVNSTLTLKRDGHTLALCSTDDFNHGTPDFAGVAAQAGSADFVLYAPHSPDALPQAFDVSTPPFFDLAVCGHTHGGQISIFGIAPHTASRYGFFFGNRFNSGMKTEQGVPVIVSNGVGTSWLSIRFGAPAQYHLITLRSLRKD